MRPYGDGTSGRDDGGEGGGAVECGAIERVAGERGAVERRASEHGAAARHSPGEHTMVGQRSRCWREARRSASSRTLRAPWQVHVSERMVWAGSAPLCEQPQA